MLLTNEDGYIVVHINTRWALWCIQTQFRVYKGVYFSRLLHTFFE